MGFKRISSAESGYTIVELVLVIVVSGIFIASTSTVLSANSRIAERGRDVTALNHYVEGKVESIRSAGYLAAVTGSSNITSELPSELIDASGTLTISSNSITTLKIEFDIDYKDQGQARNYKYTTLIGELGIAQ